ncbi:monovalent cation/H+ antiporter subunit D [Marinospirillum alkaliphilum]|uniref:Multicomponent K+:H+ antiporter subunit D n=1 Tax=Marinospirillum alkaliphilum DSM 21637 TaxID=1122209 RepID=A0A1K1ZMN6_9GAMM|nr:monovalent cation/H+ antiporter subunit D [Marinospirillum alkaliphilum]SFX75328.1 multicomponent K+:H+ antiporter subunit D [Marinospirillum alkaliphilum DSM 21637]
MSHLLLMPVLLPLLAGALLLLWPGLGLALQRVIGVIASLSLVVVGLQLLALAASGDYHLYALGNWAPPFGIVLVLDRLSALMLVLTAVLAAFCLLYACQGTDRLGMNFHALFQFQLLGVNGALLTGDLFNLFVFFEILLLASYALLLHGGSRARSRAGLHYVIINLVGSAVFVLALATLYGVAGTLNMADLALKVAAAPVSDRPLYLAAGVLLLVVFGIKAAILPLLFWLPRAYTAASAPVAALFAIMTKVGIYAILRVFWLVFGTGDDPLQVELLAWVWPLALATLLLGGLGALGSLSLRTLTAYLVILSVGILLATLTLASPQALAAALFYLVHSTLMTAVFFLMADLIGRQRDQGYDRFHVQAGMNNRWLMAGLFFVAAISMAGLPPFSGFISKVWILHSVYSLEQGFWLWAVILFAGLLVLVALSRGGSAWFWSSPACEKQRPLNPVELLLVVVLLSASGLLSLNAEPVMGWMLLTAEQLMEPGAYLQAHPKVAELLPGGVWK